MNELSCVDVRPLLATLADLGRELVLVGGPAVSFWASFYRDRVPELARDAPFTSKDGRTGIDPYSNGIADGAIAALGGAGRRTGAAVTDGVARNVVAAEALGEGAATAIVSTRGDAFITDAGAAGTTETMGPATEVATGAGA